MTDSTLTEVNITDKEPTKPVNPLEGNIGIGAFTINGALTHINEKIIDEVNDEVSKHIDFIIEDAQQYIYDKVQDYQSDIRYDILSLLKNKYNIDDSDADVILSGCGDFDTLDDAIQSKMEVEQDSIQIYRA